MNISSQKQQDLILCTFFHLCLFATELKLISKYQSMYFEPLIKNMLIHDTKLSSIITIVSLYLIVRHVPNQTASDNPYLMWSCIEAIVKTVAGSVLFNTYQLFNVSFALDNNIFIMYYCHYIFTIVNLSLPLAFWFVHIIVTHSATTKSHCKEVENQKTIDP
jgi:hypothetical protein